MLFNLKLTLSRTIDKVIKRGTVLESLEYDLFGSDILCVTPTVNTNGNLLKVKDPTLTKTEKQTSFFEKENKIKVENRAFNEVISFISKNKSKTTVVKIPKKNQNQNC